MMGSNHTSLYRKLLKAITSYWVYVLVLLRCGTRSIHTRKKYIHQVYEYDTQASSARGLARATNYYVLSVPTSTYMYEHRNGVNWHNFHEQLALRTSGVFVLRKFREGVSVLMGAVRGARGRGREEGLRASVNGPAFFTSSHSLRPACLPTVLLLD